MDNFSSFGKFYLYLFFINLKSWYFSKIIMSLNWNKEKEAGSASYHDLMQISVF